MSLYINLRKPVARGSRRTLTPIEVRTIRHQGIMANNSKYWSISRNDDGFLSLEWFTKTDGATWMLYEISAL